jgi:hypothetical protein
LGCIRGNESATIHLPFDCPRPLLASSRVSNVLDFPGNPSRRTRARHWFGPRFSICAMTLQELNLIDPDATKKIFPLERLLIISKNFKNNQAF